MVEPPWPYTASRRQSLHIASPTCTRRDSAERPGIAGRKGLEPRQRDDDGEVSGAVRRPSTPKREKPPRAVRRSGSKRRQGRGDRDLRLVGQEPILELAVDRHDLEVVDPSNHELTTTVKIDEATPVDPDLVRRNDPRMLARRRRRPRWTRRCIRTNGRTGPHTCGQQNPHRRPREMTPPAGHCPGLRQPVAAPHVSRGPPSRPRTRTRTQGRRSGSHRSTRGTGGSPGCEVSRSYRSARSAGASHGAGASR